MTFDLPLIFAGIVAFAVIMYVLLDGFDLGIGILFPWIQGDSDRDVMINSIAPIWDGNETWLVFGAAILYGAFPVAYSSLLPILYLPLMIMLCALVFRGVAFEFRSKAMKSKILWDIAFAGGATIAAFCQGLILGTFVQGYANVPTGMGGSFAWLSPFSIMTGLGVVAGYALLGAAWLIMKTEGQLQKTMFHAAKILIWVVGFFMALVSVWTPYIDPKIMQRWFSLPNFYYLMPLPTFTAAAVLGMVIALYKGKENWPFLLTIVTFLLGYFGLMISSWPYIVPHSVTLWQAASSPNSLKFILVGVVILLPVLLGYSSYAYWVFKGKVKAHEGYH